MQLEHKSIRAIEKYISKKQIVSEPNARKLTARLYEVKDIMKKLNDIIDKKIVSTISDDNSDGLMQELINLEIWSKELISYLRENNKNLSKLINKLSG